jgi:hypothetical protein
MLFFINPSPRRARKKTATKGSTAATPIDKRSRRSHHSRSKTSTSASDPARSRTPQRPNMAAKRRRKRKATATTMSTGKRRKARAAVTHVNPPRRRRRRLRHNPPAVVRRRARAAFGANPRRRRFRRNPGGVNVRGIGNQVIGDLKNGAAVFLGQLVARKTQGALSGMLPATVDVTTGMNSVFIKGAAAVAISVGARKLMPKYAAYAAAGAWSEVIAAGLAMSPAAGYLGAFRVRRVVPVAANRAGRVSAYPGGQRAVGAPRGVSAWPAPRVPMMSHAGG